jgi:uncharacterized protein YdeI (YjbR/CyaY-like superfamily)
MVHDAGVAAPTDGLEIRAFADREAWREWLAAEHARVPGIWIRFPRGGRGESSLTHREALEDAIAFGWIDGQRRRLDDRHWLQRFTPRTVRSRWSVINRRTALALIERGAMQPAGLREVERAQADGRWDAAYEGQARMAVPDDLAAALAARPEARARFDGLDSRNRYAILYRVQDAKRPETRARRIAGFVDMLERGDTIYP